MKKKSLASLVKDYPPGSRGLKGPVLREYARIEAARLRGWSWKDIAEGMNLPGTRAKEVADAFQRVARRVAAGQLMAPRPADMAGGGKSKDVRVHTESLLDLPAAED